MWKCPNCDEKLEELNYRVITEGREYGRALLNENQFTGSQMTTRNMIGDHDCSDSDSTNWNDDPEYSCNNCDTELNVTQLIWVNEEENDDDDEEETPPPPKPSEEERHTIIRPVQIIQQNDNINKLGSCIICKNCDYVYPIMKTENQYHIDPQDLNDCPKCGTSNSVEECTNLIRKGHFNKKT